MVTVPINTNYAHARNNACQQDTVCSFCFAVKAPHNQVLASFSGLISCCPSHLCIPYALGVSNYLQCSVKRIVNLFHTYMRLVIYPLLSFDGYLLIWNSPFMKTFLTPSPFFREKCLLSFVLLLYPYVKASWHLVTFSYLHVCLSLLDSNEMEGRDWPLWICVSTAPTKPGM